MSINFIALSLTILHYWGVGGGVAPPSEILNTPLDRFTIQTTNRGTTIYSKRWWALPF